MKTIWIYACILTCGAALAQSEQMRTTPPAPADAPVKIVPAREQKPAKPPTDDSRQVAVLSITLDAVDGEVRSARVTASRRIASYAPKVFARRGGDWEVVIEGDARHSFFVNNPALREAEAHPSSDDKYHWVGETGPIEWSLVVPLYVEGRNLGARSITIRDTRTRATILQADL